MDPAHRVPRYTAPMPTPYTLWTRRFLPLQAWRFLWLNVRMLRMVFLSHPHRVDRR